MDDDDFRDPRASRGTTGRTARTNAHLGDALEEEGEHQDHRGDGGEDELPPETPPAEGLARLRGSRNLLGDSRGGVLVLGHRPSRRRVPSADGRAGRLPREPQRERALAAHRGAPSETRRRRPGRARRARGDGDRARRSGRRDGGAGRRERRAERDGGGDCAERHGVARERRRSRGYHVDEVSLGRCSVECGDSWMCEANWQPGDRPAHTHGRCHP